MGWRTFFHEHDVSMVKLHFSAPLTRILSRGFFVTVICVPTVRMLAFFLVSFSLKQPGGEVRMGGNRGMRWCFVLPETAWRYSHVLAIGVRRTRHDAEPRVPHPDTEIRSHGYFGIRGSGCAVHGWYNSRHRHAARHRSTDEGSC